MADLSDKDAAQTVKLVGVDASGIETNYIDASANGLKVDGSAVTQPISAASLPLPTGAATSANQTTANASLASIDAGIPAGLGQTTMTASMPVAIASDQSNVPAGVSIGNNYAPTAPYTQVTVGKLMTDPDNQLIIRGDILTDEGTFRDDFSGTSLSASWTSAVASSGTVTVSNSLVNVSVANANNSSAYIVKSGDYGPISLRFQATLSQRANNQTAEVGFKNNPTATDASAFFQFTGTDNTKVTCITSWSTAAADQQTTTVTIPNGTSATSNDYYIEVQPDQISFLINGILVAQHRLHIPGPYQSMNVVARIFNSAGGTGTATLALDYVYFIDQNAIQVTNSFLGDPAAAIVQSGTVASYSASIVNLVAANTATDIFTLTGSVTKTIKIQNVYVSATQTTAGNANILFIKRSTANAAGTSTTPAAVPLDSANAAATGVVRAYTANPTLGTAVGTIYSRKLFVPTTTTIGTELVWMTSQDPNTQAIVLRGTGDVFAINLNSTTIAGNSFNIAITWTES